MRFEFEHIAPRSRGGETTFENLCLACSSCNQLKGDQIEFADPISGHHVAVFHPQRQVWMEHFAWEQNGSTVLGKTAIGRAVVETLQMNREVLVSMREMWVIFGQHPPEGSLGSVANL
jgi:CRISPR/Cas system Type II protein with McrA/HNH and RuvC-like nuclease domain